MISNADLLVIVVIVRLVGELIGYAPVGVPKTQAFLENDSVRPPGRIDRGIEFDVVRNKNEFV